MGSSAGLIERDAYGSAPDAGLLGPDPADELEGPRLVEVGVLDDCETSRPGLGSGQQHPHDVVLGQAELAAMVRKSDACELPSEGGDIVVVEGYRDEATWAPCNARPPKIVSMAWLISCSPPDAGRDVPETIIDMPESTRASARWRRNR